MILRNYQQEAITAAIRSLKNNPKNPCIVAPTGSGKSVIIAFLIKQLLQIKPDVRILILAHVKELVSQNFNKLKTIAPELDIGIYCAGLNRKDINKSITFSSIISAWNAIKNGCLESNIGHIDLIIVDEAHRINTKDEGVYRELIKLYKKDCKAKTLGLTATPFRTGAGSIITDEGILNLICYNISIPDLIEKKYIAKPFTVSAQNDFDLTNVALKNGDFDAAESFAIMKNIKEITIKEMVMKTIGRKHIICFCCNIEHANILTNKLNTSGISAKVLHSKLNDRDNIINDFKAGKFRCLVNINILTEGFDAPFIDCVILMRATMSPGLYVQMIGRGFRITEHKKDFLVLDFGQNIERHGCVDDIQTQKSKVTKNGCAPVKKCPRCQCMVFLSARICPSCRYEYEFSNPDYSDTIASNEAILTANMMPKIVTVKSVNYYVHAKKGKPKSIKVRYNTGNLGFIPYNEYVCLYHDGFAKTVATNWWEERSCEEIPDDIYEAIDMAKEFKVPTKITIEKNGKFWNIVDYEFHNQPSKLQDDYDEEEDILF